MGQGLSISKKAPIDPLGHHKAENFPYTIYCIIQRVQIDQKHTISPIGKINYFL